MKQTETALPTQTDFPALTAKALAGDQAAYTALYDATAQEVYRCIHAMIRDEELTLDLQQEVYTQAFTHLAQLEDPEKLIPWLRSIAVNCVRHALRRQTPLLFSELEDGDGPALPELADESPDASPELRLEQKETARYVREILDGLTPGQRLLVGLYYYEQRPVGQIARELGVTPGTVKTQLFRSRKKIEAAVKRLEARGVKLYGLSPLPFLLALLKRAEPAAESGHRIRSAALVKSGVSAAEASGVYLGRRFLETASGRLLLGLLAAAALGGGILGWRWTQKRFPIGDYRPTADSSPLWESTEAPSRRETALPPDSTPVPETTELPEPDTEPAAPPETGPPEPSTPETASSASGSPSQQSTQPAASPVPAPTPIWNETTEPSEPVPAALSLSWHWQYGGALDWTMDWNAGAGEDGYESRTLTVTMSGIGRPALEADDPGLLRIRADSANTSQNNQIYEAMGWSREYSWTVTPLADGTTTIRCVVNSRTEKSLRVTVQTSARLLRADLYTDHASVPNPEAAMADCSVGAVFGTSAWVLGPQAPALSTDNPAVVQISSLIAEPGAPPKTHYTATLSIVGAGDARVFLSYDGQIVRSWSVHASEPTPPAASQEDLSP